MNCRGSSGPGRLKPGVAPTPAQNKLQLHYTLFLKAPCAMLMFQHARELWQLQLVHDSGIMAGMQMTPLLIITCCALKPHHCCLSCNT
jgi:hypothetical protein